MDFPREKAAELAASLIRGVNEYSAEQKKMIANAMDIDKFYAKKVKDLQTALVDARDQGDKEAIERLEREISVISCCRLSMRRPTSIN